MGNVLILLQFFKKLCFVRGPFFIFVSKRILIFD